MSAATSPTISPDEQQIRDLIDTWCAASADGDLVAQMNLMTEDVLFLNARRASRCVARNLPHDSNP